jgi:hypothetical protein
MYFDTKNTLKSNCNHTFKQTQYFAGGIESEMTNEVYID